jgi:Protein of unknown function (DUF1236)
MRREILIATTALTIVAGGQAWAQTVIELNPQQRTTIKEYVVREKVKPITVKERIVVGATLPTEVELVTVPSAWGPSVVKYRYVYDGNRVVFVDPSSRKVIQIIE